MKLNLEKLRHYIADYKQLIQTPRYDELYKWEAAKNFNDHWDEHATDVVDMIDKSLNARWSNLWAGNHFFLKRMLLEMANFNSVRLLDLFKILFDESQNLEKRATIFRDEMVKLGKKAFPEKNVYHGDHRATMLYLGLRFPGKYPLYKFEMLKSFAQLVKCSEQVKKANSTDRFSPVRQYLELCKIVREELEKDSELLILHRELLDPAIHYSSDYGALLTQDFIYCTANYNLPQYPVGTPGEEEIDYLNEEGESYITTKPTFWLIAPGENARLWDNFYNESIMAIGWEELGDLRQYPDKQAIAGKMRELEETDSNKMNDRLACWEFAWAVKPGDIVIAKKGRKTYLGWGVVSSGYRYEPQRPEYPNVREVEWKAKGEWQEDSPPIILKTLTDISKYPEYVQKLKTLMGIEEKDIEPYEPAISATQQYWWLNANPKIWGIDETLLGQTQNYTSHNENNNKRQKYKYFTQVKPGDILIGYETHPTRKVKAIFEVTAPLHEHPSQGEAFSFRKILELKQPIDFEKLKSLPALQSCEPLRNNQGSLYRLTEEEYGIIRDIIDTSNAELEAAEKAVKPYSKADALRDLFLPEANFDRIIRALLHKKNIVLQGAPGVGKTFVAKRLAKTMLGKDDERKICMVQFHQSYSYEDFVMGIRPNEDGQFVRRKGIFYEFCEQAQNDPANPYFLIIDEINRGNLSKIFGELMLLIEADKRGKEHAMPLTYSESGETFYLPENLYLIGTMNTADRSLAMVDYALRRRFAFLELEPEFGAIFEAYLSQKGIPETLVKTIIRNIQAVNQRIVDDPNLGKGFRIGHSYFCANNMVNDISPEQWFRDIVELEIAPQLREYWFDNSEKAEDAISVLSQNLPTYG